MQASPRATEDVRAPAGSLRELVLVAWPLVLSSGSISLAYVVDRIFLTWYSAEALAASLPAAMLHWTLLSLGLGVANYVAAFVAQYEGAGRPERVAAIVWQGLYFSAIAGATLLLAAPFSTEICDWFGHPPEVARLEAEYFGWLLLQGGPALASAALASYFAGRGRTTVILWVDAAGALANMGLDYWFIFDHHGRPGWGVAGAAIATVLSSVVTFVLFAVWMARDSETARYRFGGKWAFDGPLFQRLLRFGLPNGLGCMLDGVCFAVFLLLLGQIGTVELTASNLAFNLNGLAFVPMMGVGTAVLTLVGRRLGENRPRLAIRTTWLAAALACAYMTAFVLVYLAVPDLLIAPYALHADAADFAQLRSLVIVLLRFVALYSVFDALCIVFGSALRGAGDTVFAMGYSLTCGLTLMVLPTYLACRWLDDKLMAAWWAISFFIAVLAGGYVARFQGGRWMSMRVIEPTLVDGERESAADEAPSVIADNLGARVPEVAAESV